MSINIKTPNEIKIMQEGGIKLSRILKQLVSSTRVGTSLLDIEKLANELIIKEGGEAAFKRVPGYFWATCLNINEGIVHGVPFDYELKNNDLLSIDIGMFYKGFNTDTCVTIGIKQSAFGNQPFDYAQGKQSAKSNKIDEIDKFLIAGRQALKAAKKEAQPGNFVGHISRKIQEIIEGKGYACARTLTGHGVGKLLHEEPLIPCFLDKDIRETPLLEENMVIAIEIIYCQGSSELVTEAKDGWTIKTKDGKMSGVLEETVALCKNGPLVLTELPIPLCF
jgi:methionyl aminopeptidase